MQKVRIKLGNTVSDTRAILNDDGFEKEIHVLAIKIKSARKGNPLATNKAWLLVGNIEVEKA